jgi:hypothetical protein
MKDWLINGINQYFDWLKKRTLVSEDETTGWSVISTPFTGLFNDTIDIFAKQTSDGRVILSDDGNTMNNLELFGVVFKNTQGRKSIIERIKLNYGVTIVKDEITKTIAMSDFVQGKHDMLRAILELSDMINLTTHRITSSFKDDVKNLFNEKEMNVTPDFIVSGRSGIRFTFDYLIAKPKKETVIQVFNNFDKANLATFLLGIDEVKYPRELLSSKKLEPIAIINDTEAKVREEYLEALRNRDMSYLFWSDHEKPEFISKRVA